MGLHIPIKVDTAPVRKGILDVQTFESELSKLEELGQIDITMTGVKTFAEAAQAMDVLLDGQQRLEDITRSSNGFFSTVAQERLKELHKQREALEEIMDLTERREAREKRANEGGPPRRPRRPGGDGGGGSGDGASDHSNTDAIKKALKWGLAAAGGFSILAFLGQSRSRYQQSVGHEATLNARGISGGYGAGVGLGMGPLEYMALMENISQSAGMGGSRARGASRLSAAFGRANGVDPNSVGTMYGTMYGATGNAGLASPALMLMAESVKKGMDKARMSELLSMVARNTNLTAQSMHGAGASNSQALTAAAMAAAVMGLKDDATYKQYAKSTEFANVAQNGLRGAGSAPGEIMLWKELGGFNGQMSWRKMFEMEQMKEGGFLQNPQALKGILGNLSGSREDQAAQLMKMFPDWKLSTKGATSLIDIADSPLFRDAAASGKNMQGLKGGSRGERRLAADLEKEFNSLPGAGKMTLAAQVEAEQIKAGEKLNAMFNKLERVGLRVIDKLADSKAVDHLVKAFENLGGTVNTLIDYIENPTKATAKRAGKGILNTGKEALQSLEGIPGTISWGKKFVTEAAADGKSPFGALGDLIFQKITLPIVDALHKANNDPNWRGTAPAARPVSSR